MASLSKSCLLLLLVQLLAHFVFAGTDNGGNDYTKPEIETDYKGGWVIDNPNVGVSAMHIQLMPNDQVIWYDATSLGQSARVLEPEGNCPINPDANNQPDCWAHAVAYEWKTSKSRTVEVCFYLLASHQLMNI